MSTLSSDDLREITAQIAGDLGVAGAQSALIVGGQLIEASVGIANRELDLPVTNDTVFQIGSTTKVWTAVLMMQLVEEGLVGLDEPVTTYLPAVQLAAGEEWRAITPRHLLSMSSGLDNGPYTDTGRGDDAIEKYVALLADYPLNSRPGEHFGYSNAATSVAGLIIERITGSPWDDVLIKKLLEPAGLTESVSLFDRLPFHRVAVGQYPGEARSHRPWHFGRGMSPLGATLATSARDLARFGQIFVEGGATPEGARLVSAATIATMQTPQIAVPPRGYVDDWCLGMYHRDWAGIDVFGHPGTTYSGGSHLIWIPALGITLATTLNSPTLNAPFTVAIHDAVLREGLGLPVPGTPQPLTEPVDPTPYVGRYVSLGRDFEVAIEDGSLRLTLMGAADHDSLADVQNVSSLILPVGPHRFTAIDPAVTWGYGWEIAFTIGNDGRASLLHNGAMASRRNNEREGMT